MNFHFYSGPWENSELPTIVREDPDGGDPRILAVLSRIHNPEALYEMCRLANGGQATAEGAPDSAALPPPATSDAAVLADRPAGTETRDVP